MQDIDILVTDSEAKARLALFQPGGVYLSVSYSLSGIKIYLRTDLVIVDADYITECVAKTLGSVNIQLDEKYVGHGVFAQLGEIINQRVVVSIEIITHGMSGALFVEQDRHKEVVSKIYNKVLIPF